MVFLNRAPDKTLHGRGVEASALRSDMAADWACASCTLLNSRERDACDACGAAAGAPERVPQEEEHSRCDSEHGYEDEQDEDEDEDEDEQDDIAFAEVDESPPGFFVPVELAESFRRIQLAQDEDAAAAAQEEELLLARRDWKRDWEHQEQCVKNAEHRRTTCQRGRVDVGALHAHVSARLQITERGPSVEAAEGLHVISHFAYFDDGTRSDHFACDFVDDFGTGSNSNPRRISRFRRIDPISEAQWVYVVQLFTAFVYLSYSTVPLQVGSEERSQGMQLAAARKRALLLMLPGNGRLVLDKARALVRTLTLLGTRLGISTITTTTGGFPFVAKILEGLVALPPLTTWA